MTVLAAGGTIAMAGAGRRGPAARRGGARGGRARRWPAVPGPAGPHARRLARRPRRRGRRARDRPRRGRRGRGRARRRRHARDRHARGDRRPLRPAPRRRRPDRADGRDPPGERQRAPTGRRTCSTRSAPPARRRPPGAGAIVAFAGELHAARAVRKVDSTSPRAFASPRSGPMGRVIEERVDVWGRPHRRPPLPVAHLDARVEIVPAALGSDGAMLDAALAAGADGIVAVLLGAGHAPPAFLRACSPAAERVPVVACVRPESRPDPARHLRLRGRRARRARRGADARAVALPRRGADHADGLPRRGPQPRRHRRGVRAQRSLTVHRRHHRIVTESLHSAGNLMA